MKMRIKKGDQVVVLAGKDKGSKGKVVQTNPEKGEVIVEGVNMVTKHQKPRQSAKTRATPQTQTGRITKPAPLAVGKVMLVCPRCGEPSRVGSETTEGKHVRVCKHCHEYIDVV